MPIPVQGDYYVTALYGPTGEKLDSGGFNKGIDIGVPVGTRIQATTGGVVVSAGDSGDGWGTSVKVRDADGNVHNYGHLSDLNVYPGMEIPAGYWVANSGNTGASTGPHLSYDVLGTGGSYVDPSPWLGISAAGSNYGFSSTPLSTFGVPQGDLVPMSQDPFSSGPSGASNPGPRSPNPTNPNGGSDSYTNYYDAQGNWVQRNETTGQITILKSAQAPPSAGAPITKTINGVTYQWNGSSWAPASGLPAESQGASGPYVSWMTRPDGTMVGYDPRNGAILAEYADPGTWQTVNLGNGQVVQVNSKTGEQRPISGGQPQGPAIPAIASASSAGVWTQDPRTGELKWTPTPGTGSSALKPASAQYTYSGPSGGSRPTAASADPYKSQQMAIQAAAAEAARQREFTSGQNTIDRQLQVYRDAAGQRFTGGENAVDRNMNNAQFGANFGLNREGLDLQRRQFGLEGAKTYASLVSTPDLAALPAFLQAGGGNVINGIAGGADMITPNSVLPGALALQQLRQPFNALPEYNYTPEANPNIPAALPMPALANGGMVRDPMFMVGDRPDGMPTGTEEVVLNPTGAPLGVLSNADLRGPRDITGEATVRDMPRYATGTYSTVVGGVAGGANPLDYTGEGPTPPPPVSGMPLPRGYVAVDPKDIPQDRLGPAGTQWTYAHNPTTGKVVRIAPDGKQYGMYSTITPPTAQRTTGGYNTPGPRSVTGAVRNAISRANTVGGNAVGVNQAALNRSVFGPNPYGFQYNPGASAGGSSRPSAFRPPASQPAPTTGTPPGTVDTPAGSVNTNTGNVSQNPPATPAETAQTDNSIQTNMQTVEDFRRNFEPAVPWNPMAADYWEQSPDLREISEFGQQTKFGTPVRTLQNDAQRFRLPGVSRSSLALGV